MSEAAIVRPRSGDATDDPDIVRPRARDRLPPHVPEYDLVPVASGVVPDLRVAQDVDVVRAARPDLLERFGVPRADDGRPRRSIPVQRMIIDSDGPRVRCR